VSYEKLKIELAMFRKLCNTMLDSFEEEIEKLSNQKIVANNSVQVENAVKDQDIETAEFTVPVIYAGVLHYKPGELGSTTDIGVSGGDVYYSPESVSDPEYLETIMRSPVNIGTHELNTGEHNLEVHGWPTKVWYDEKMGAAMVKGYVIGKSNCEYVRENKANPNFGSSASIGFLGVKREEGIAPDGKSYNAKTTKLVNKHIALLPNIRDSKNVILALNALNEQAPVDQEPTKTQEKKIMADEIDKDSLKNAVDELEKEKAKNAEWEDMKNRVKNAESEIAEFKKNAAKNEAYKGEETKKEEEEEKKEEEKAAENATNSIPMPSQELIKDISNHYGMVYTKTPSFERLASDVGIETKEKPFAEIVGALNAKRQEIISKVPTATNSDKSDKKESASFNDMLNMM